MIEITTRGVSSKSYKYYVTEDGRVFRESIRTGVMKEMYYHMAHGYRRVRISDTSTGTRRYYRVSRLVASAYLPEVSGKEYVNHKDGNKENDTIENLEWCTISENTQHAYDNDLIKDRGGWKSTPYHERTSQYRDKEVI